MPRVQGGLVLCVLALATTLPLALLGPAPAATGDVGLQHGVARAVPDADRRRARWRR